VLIACPKCGAANDEHAQECYVCGAIYAFEEEAIERETPTMTIEPVDETVELGRPVASKAPEAESNENEEPAELMEPAEAGANGEAGDSEEEPAEVIGFAPPLAARRPTEREIEVTPAAAAQVNVTDGTSALDPAPVSRVKEMPRPSGTRRNEAGRGTEPALPQAEPEWRREVTRRLEDYRARRSRAGRVAAAAGGITQSALPFGDPMERQSPTLPRFSTPLEEPPDTEESIPKPLMVTLEDTVELAHEQPLSKKLEGERIEIDVPQPSFNLVVWDEGETHPLSKLVPVADLRERSRAMLLDAFFLAISFAGFLVLFRALGGQITFGKQEAMVYGAALFLFYAIYFSLFTLCGGATPGMYFRGLSVVAFDGRMPETGQLVRRAFGYVVSGGTLALGFLWALWDEDRLTWHDRMSQTYLTRGSPTLWSDLSDTDDSVTGESSEAPPPAT
jgi:uncharacterized RDD family membrane protein YckC